MDRLNYDTTNLIFENMSVDDKLRLHRMFNERKPTQFSVSKGMLENKNMRDERGLDMRAITTGELEPCVQVVSKLNASVSENQIRNDFELYDEFQRVDRVKMFRMMYT